MATLTGKTPAQTYKDLLQVSNSNAGVDSTLRAIEDGEGTTSAGRISTNKFQVRPASNGTDTFEVVNSSGSVLFYIDTTNNKVVLNSGVVLEGDGSGLTGVLSAGVGGASSTGDLVMQADSDSSGSGDAIFKIGTKVVARIPYSYVSSLPVGVEGNYFIKTIADNWGNPKGGVILDGVDDYYSVADNDNLDFGTGDSSLVASKVNFKTFKAEYFLSKRIVGQAYYGLYPTSTSSTSSTITVYISDGTNTVTFASNGTLGINTDYHIAWTVDRDGLMSLYINGALDKTISVVSVSGNVSNTTDFRLGAFSTTYQNMEIGGVKVFNRALTQAEVTKLYNNGRPDLAELDYADIGASQTALTSGTLVIGKRYKIDTFVAGDDFTNVATVESGTINTTGCVFICKSTTPTAWTNSSSLRSLGCTFQLKGEDFGRIGAVESMNGLHASSSGSPRALAPEQGQSKYRDVKLSIANTATALTSIVPKGYRIASIRAKGSASLTGVKIGTSSGGEQVVASTTAGTTATLLTLAATANAGYSETASVTLYAEHATVAQTLNLIFEFEKVAN